jgi:hypothetical protein
LNEIRPQSGAFLQPLPSIAQSIQFFEIDPRRLVANPELDRNLFDAAQRFRD